MPSSLFPPQNNQGNSILAAINTIKGISNGNPQALFEQMYQNNSQFRQFADTVKGKSPEQAFSEHGLDYTKIRELF